MINQSNATSLCHMTNKMQLYYMIYILMVQDRAFTLMTIVLAVAIFYLTV